MACFQGWGMAAELSEEAEEVVEEEEEEEEEMCRWIFYSD